MGLLDAVRSRWRRSLGNASNPGISALPATGRSSEESQNSLVSGAASYLSYWDGVEPLLPHSYLDQIIRIAVVNPDMSQAVSNWIAIGNQGHEIIISGTDDAVAAANKRLNEKARTLARNTAGIDGLVNKFLEQVALSGAISSEDIVSLGANPGVEEVVIVPVPQIRFRRDGKSHVPYQLVNGKEIALNPVTYRYLAYMTIENSPYAKPPMVAALEPILDQQMMKKNLQFVLKKFGLFGLVSATVTPPKQDSGETAGEYQKRVQAHLQEVLNAFKENFREGLAVFTSDIKVERTNITTDVRGIQEIFRMNEEQVFSGMTTDPAMHGRTYSTTETYARVVYNMLLRHTESFQRPVKRRIERTYQLDLALAGIPVTEISLHFKRGQAQDPLVDAKSDQLQWKVLRDKVEAGLITPTAAARAMGHDSWHDVERIGFEKTVAMATDTNQPEVEHHRLVFDSQGQRYNHVRPSINLSTTTSNNSDDEPAESYTTVENWLDLPASVESIEQIGDRVS